MKKNFLYAALGGLMLLTACSSTNSMTNLTSGERTLTVQEHISNTNNHHSSVTDSNEAPLATPQPNIEKSLDAVQTDPEEYDYVLIFPSDNYPETALHIFNAIENGYSDVCTIDRAGADENRKQSLKGIDTKDGYDRDEWPMAMCEEGGLGASVAYIDSSDNRGAGSWVGHQLSAYEDGERILFIVEKPRLLFGEAAYEATTETKELTDEDILYNNCTEAREAGVTPIFEGEPGYSKKLDRDGDGIACEA